MDFDPCLPQVVRMLEPMVKQNEQAEACSIYLNGTSTFLRSSGSKLKIYKV